MTFKVTSRFVVFWICCVPFSTFAQQDEIASRHYSMKDGLSNDGAMSLLQDSKGFLWVGTYSGLNKFDGYHFTTYLENPDDPNSLINNHVEFLWEDDQQRLWIGTEAGLQLFDLTTEKFHHLRTDSLDPDKGSTIDILKIRILKIRERKDGKVWICTAQGIYLADPQTLFITKVNVLEDRHQVLKDSVYGNTFYDIAETRDGAIWAGTEEGLVHIDSHTGQTTRYLHDSKDPKSLTSDIVKRVHIDRHDRIWAGTQQGLDLFNPQDQSFTHFVPGQSKAPLSNIEVVAIFENPDGKFWIGFHPGLYAFDPDTGKFGALMHQNIWSILQDRQGIMWIASAHGLFQITQGENKFIYSRQFGPSSVANVRVFAEDKNHHIWIAAHNSDHQLFRYDPSSRKFFQYDYDPLDPYSFSGNSIMGIIPDKDGGVWIASYLNLHKFNSQHQTFLNITLPFEPTTLLKDSKGKIWLGKWAGVEVYDPQSNKHEPLLNFPRTEVTSVVEDRAENIWIGTNDGLFRYSLKTGQLDVFKHNPADPQSLSHNRIEHLMIDQEGTIWLGTFGGLNKMVPGTGETKFNHWQTTNSHLPHDLVFCVIDGGDGTIWMSCGNRISHFFPQSGEFRNYDHSDGLHGQLIFKGLRSHRGEIYFSSRVGLIAFHPDSLKDNLYLPPVAITGFYIHNEPVSVLGSYGDTLSWKTPLTYAITYTDEVAVTHLRNDLTFEFAALNYSKQEKNQYKYKLEPYEKKWIETSADNRIARYTNLSPGRYIFRVIGSNNDGVWNEEGATLVIVITPPWWKTWWAYSLYGIALVGLLVAARRNIIHRERLTSKLKLEHLELEKVQEIDKVKTNFFANISHEFRTPITLILGPLKDLYNKANSEEQKSVLGTMMRNGQRLLRLINQLLDLSKLEAGRMTLQASQTDLVQFLKEIAASYESLATDKKIKFFFYPEVQDLFICLDAEKMEKVFHNLLSNAFKFTREGGEIILNLKAGENESINNSKRHRDRHTRRSTR